MGKAGRGQRPGSTGCEHLPWGKAFHTGRWSPARRAGDRTSPPPRERQPHTGLPSPRAPGSGLAASAGRPGRGPRSLAPFPQTRGGASSQSSGARLPAPCPWPHEGHPERTERAGGRGSEHSLTLSRLRLVTRQPQTSLSPQASSYSQKRLGSGEEVGGVPKGRPLPVSSPPRFCLAPWPEVQPRRPPFFLRAEGGAC